MVDTPMLRDRYRALRAEAMYFLGEGKQQKFNAMVEDEMRFLEMKAKPKAYVEAAEIVLRNLAMLDAEDKLYDDIFTFHEERL